MLNNSYISNNCILYIYIRLATVQKSHYIHQVTTSLATSKNVLFPGLNHLL